MKEAHSLSERDEIYAPAENTLSGYGAMAGNSINENSRDTLEGAQSDSPGMQTMLAYLGQDAASATTTSEESLSQQRNLIPQDNDGGGDSDLINKLENLVYLQTVITNWFGPIKKGQTILNYSNNIHQAYVTVFGENPITAEEIDGFIARSGIEAGKENALDIEEWMQPRANDLRTFLGDRKGADILQSLKTEGDAAILYYDEFIPLKNKRDEAEMAIESYNNTVEPRVSSLTATKDDITVAEDMKKKLEAFATGYAAAKSTYLQTQYATTNANYSAQINSFGDLITDINDAIAKAEKRRSELKKMEEMDETARTEYNPPISEADVRSGIGYKNKAKEGEDADRENNSFLKSKNIYNKKERTYSMFKKSEDNTEDVDMDDVVQGLLGDCYLMSSLAAVARKNPALIRSLISYNEKDTYATVTLHVKNDAGERVPKKINVSLYVPVKSYSEAYAKSGDGELWVMMIEKAYAKEMGGYENIGLGGNASEAMAVLTGNESTYKRVKDDKKALEKDLTEATAEGKIAVAGTKLHTQITSPAPQPINGDAANGYEVDLGDGRKIVCQHAYTVISVTDTDGVKKITLRNPYGGSGSLITLTFDEFKNYFSGISIGTL